MKKLKFNIMYLILLFPLSLGLSYLAARSPIIVEQAYSNFIYRYIAQFISNITGIFPFSVAELIIVATIITVLVNLIYRLNEIFKQPKEWKSILLKQLKLAAITISVIYFVFLIVWGLNYHREPIASMLNLEVTASSVEELVLLNKYLIEQANELRALVVEDTSGITISPKGTRDILNRAELGFIVASEIYPELGGRYGRPKSALFSTILSYQGIGGVYFPFTAEPNVNVNRPHFLIPFTTMHEIAHQRGVAREDEANYIGYITSIMHPDYDFQYSGTMMALNYSMGALRRYDIEKHNELRAGFSPGVVRDFAAWSEHSQKHQGVVREAATRINNAYLQANAQMDGVHSYGRMVDLLIAYYRQTETIQIMY
ncbi:DUF3810 domain-containing protein [Desulfuribacillus alkaliarsenatis]|uniref:DUF3810 domain-containing protein n=1 Tax=Desulfuribacillus alkaliarsenatis TaxID=766136 RepID=A0A1E5G2V7_9FIRM|nr:DUF3810 domain-containing protein [Desulfuribacillus alkaliarsenatis]OEF97406.1 hypothetical protein BHF68_04145 [Desulfuribacillus alkaliarsenatis]